MEEQHRNSDGKPRESQGKPRGEVGESRGSGGLEHISEILSRAQGNRAGKSSGEMSPKPPRQETRIEECVCKTCGSKFQGQITLFTFTKPPREVRPNECPACRAIREAEEKAKNERELEDARGILRSAWMRRCGIPVLFQDMIWENLDPGYMPRQQQICRQWAEKFDLAKPSQSPSLFIMSPGPGVGKTLLCSLIGIQVIMNWHGEPEGARCPVLFLSGPQLVMRLRSTYDIPADRPNHEREENVYRDLKGVRLLILDDVGKEQPRSYRWNQEVYWTIINERVAAGLPIVMNSGLPLTGEDSLEALMGKDTVDRLYGMCRGKVIELKGESYRHLKKQP